MRIPGLLLIALLLLCPARAEDVNQEVRRALPGTYQVKYWEMGEGRSKAPGTETMVVKPQGTVYAVTWTGAGEPIQGIGIAQVDRGHATFSVGYSESGQVGVIVYDVVWDRQSVKLANGHWVTGVKADKFGLEEASRLR